MNGILSEFNEIYEEKIRRLAHPSSGDHNPLQKKCEIFESWIRDLTEQNNVLVSTVEDLEQEASQRVCLLQDKLEDVRVAAKSSSVSLTDHRDHVEWMIRDRGEAKQESVNLHKEVARLAEENRRLKAFVENSLKQLKDTAQVYGPPISSPAADDEKFTISSLPAYDGGGSETELGFKLMEETLNACLSNLTSGIHTLKQSQIEKNSLLIQKDRTIADLQCQVTDLCERLQSCSVEEENRKEQSILSDWIDPGNTSENELEEELGQNIDVMSERMASLEEECLRLTQRNSYLEQISEDQVVQDQVCLTSYSKDKTHSKSTQTEMRCIRKASGDSNSGIDMFGSFMKISKLENEISEKNILVRELQNHLLKSREELQLKDHVLNNVEDKLSGVRGRLTEKENRTQFLETQLSELQNQIGEQYGRIRTLKQLVESKTGVVSRLEEENLSLTESLNAKSCLHETLQKAVADLSLQISEKNMVLGNLQDRLEDLKRAQSHWPAPCQNQMANHEAEGHVDNIIFKDQNNVPVQTSLNDVSQCSKRIITSPDPTLHEYFNVSSHSLSTDSQNVNIPIGNIENTFEKESFEKGIISPETAKCTDSFRLRDKHAPNISRLLENHPLHLDDSTIHGILRDPTDRLISNEVYSLPSISRAPANHSFLKPSSPSDSGIVHDDWGES